MSDDVRDTGIPTRAIHESYLDLQQAHRQFRRAAEHGDVDNTAAHATFQDATLSFYELLRPHLRHEPALEDYWTGSLPDYTGWDFEDDAEALSYIRDHATGLYQLQCHTDIVAMNGQARADGGLSTFRDWHNALGLTEQTERLIAVEPTDGGQFVVKLARAALLPLRTLDGWSVRVRAERQRGDGFMAGETAIETTREYEAPQKIVAAKRLLVEAADELSLLSQVETSAQRTEITREDIEKVEAWHQEQTN